MENWTNFQLGPMSHALDVGINQQQEQTLC